MIDSEAARPVAAGVARPAIEAAEVAAFLRANPAFLAEHPELVQVLAAPLREGLGAGPRDKVADLQRFMVERLQADIKRLNGAHEDIVATTRANLSSQARVHAAVIAMMGATTLEHLVEVIATDLAVHLELDAIVLAFEALDRVPPGGNRTALRLLPRGTIERLMSGARDVQLIADQAADVTVFGAAAPLVRSQALVRLDLRRHAPLGLMALGSRHAGHFHPGLGTELLSFLGRAVELSIRAWLDRG